MSQTIDNYFDCLEKIGDDSYKTIAVLGKIIKNLGNYRRKNDIIRSLKNMSNLYQFDKEFKVIKSMSKDAILDIMNGKQKVKKRTQMRLF